MNERHFSFHGVHAVVRCADEEILEAVRHDFSYFLVPPASPELCIVVSREDPDYAALPPMRAQIATPRNISFRSGDTLYIDYFGRALNVCNTRTGQFQVTARDLHLAREIVFLTILSQVCARLESKGIHRIHGLGLEKDGRGCLVLLPSGGGKSTLALSILTAQNNGVRLIAEDSPLIRRDGWLLPFPLSLGVHPGRLPDGVDPRYTRLEKRMEFKAKISIDVGCFADRLVHEPVRPTAILLGHRTTGLDSRITEAARRDVVRHALMNSVVGVGLYQGMEFIFQQGLGDVVSHAARGFSRIWNNLRLIGHAKIYDFFIGRDTAKNQRTLLEFLAQRL